MDHKVVIFLCSLKLNIDYILQGVSINKVVKGDMKITYRVLICSGRLTREMSHEKQSQVLCQLPAPFLAFFQNRRVLNGK